MQSAAFDPSSQIWPVSMDIAMPGTDAGLGVDTRMGPYEQPQLDGDMNNPAAYTDSGGVFMGVSTPPASGGL